MIRKFKVSNFKSFSDNFEFDLTQTNGYEFNKEAVKNGIVNNALIYGHNGVGKSNLALAMFDIIEHLTDKNKYETAYHNYLNAGNNSKYAEFYYEFEINSKTVIYEYKKSDYKTIVSERLTIDKEEVVFFDREEEKVVFIKLSGAENLKKEINNNELSILKYIKNNTILDSNSINKTFTDFFCFIEKMLYFCNLQSNTYIGLRDGTENIIENIVENKNSKDFEDFLNAAGVECKLSETATIKNKKTLAFNFNGNQVPFKWAASTGTNSLALFYFWFQSIRDASKVSFLFIDEFDAFYHHELSTWLIKKLKEVGVQFVLTTHNTSVLTNELLRPDCYFLMNKQRIKSLSKCTQKDLREAHNIEKMYKANAFNVE
ncbi:MAG: AAA family ATPase [Bacteroidales bacterium]